MKKPLFLGVATALITPINNKNKIDYRFFKEQIESQIKNKVSAIVVLGTTGEPSTISNIERRKIIKTAVKTVKKKIPVIVGCGSNSTKQAVKLCIMAKRLKADGALCVTPYYNKCSNSGLYLHFKEISDKANFPIIFYNVPSRTGIDIPIDVAKKIAKLKNVVGYKNSPKTFDELKLSIDKLNDIIPVYIGSDEYYFDGLKEKASGIISVVSNIIPDKITANYCYFRKFGEFLEEEKIMGLIKALSKEVNPIPIKTAVKNLYGKGYFMRLPLTKLDDKKEKLLNKELKKFYKE